MRLHSTPIRETKNFVVQSWNIDEHCALAHLILRALLYPNLLACGWLGRGHSASGSRSSAIASQQKLIGQGELQQTNIPEIPQLLSADQSDLTCTC